MSDLIRSLTETTPSGSCGRSLPNDLCFLISADALTAKLGTLSVEAQSKLEKDTAKKEAKAEAKEVAEAKKKLVRLMWSSPAASELGSPTFIQIGL